MGRGKGPTGSLIAAGVLLLCGAAAPTALPLREARWLEAKDLAADLTRLPTECRSAYPDLQAQRSAEIGRIAFHSPLLLGGQAARVGLSCSSCHPNGRSNRDFHFPGLSGEPGTADVTASLMSSHRGDGIFNPRQIPDLAGDPRKLKVSRDADKGDLERFIHGLITQEFDGPEPPRPVLEGLAAYVRSLSPAACAGPATTPIRLPAMLDDVETAVELARERTSNGDHATAHVLISAARSMLGSINERFEVPGGEESQSLLRAADLDLKAMALADSMQPHLFADWERSWPGRVRLLRSAEHLSLFSEAVVRRRLAN